MNLNLYLVYKEPDTEIHYFGTPTHLQDPLDIRIYSGEYNRYPLMVVGGRRIQVEYIQFLVILLTWTIKKVTFIGKTLPFSYVLFLAYRPMWRKIEMVTK